jgi:peptidoglycan/xylan/chitin deacetylase (PgdA/CDA1 family)/WD40 repeat protein
MKRNIFKRLLKSLILVPLLGIFSFSSLDLSQDNKLLYTLHSDPSGFRQGYGSLLMHQLEQGTQQILSFYPEKTYYNTGDEVFYIQNRLGLFQGNLETHRMNSMDFYPSYGPGNPPRLGRLEPLSLSPDGNYIIYFQRQGVVSGNLVLRDLVRNTESIIAEDIEPDYTDPLAKWSPDSRIFCYSKENEIYYFSISQYLEGRIGIDRAHKIGNGGINSFNWTKDNSLVYIDGRNIYKIHATEIFALSFYDTPLQIGTVAGRLFVDFQSSRDKFWISPDGQNILVKKGEGNIFLYDMEFRDYNMNSRLISLPFMKMPVGSTVEKILWSSKGKITMLTRNRLNQGGGSIVFIYDSTNPDAGIVELNQRGILDMALSPDEKIVSLITPNSIILRGYEQWDVIMEKEIDSIVSHHWKNSREILYFGEYMSGEWDYLSDRNDFLILSQPENYGFNTHGLIQMESRGQNYTWDVENQRWNESEDNYIRDPRLSSSKYRVFLEPKGGVYFEEMIMLRKIDGYGTLPLVQNIGEVPEDFPLNDSNPIVTDGYFIHGSRIRRREVALVFNIVSEDNGLLDVLNTLSEYNLRCTFFVNGNFIRKYPGALRILVDEGHEIGSLFYTNMDFSDGQYNLDEDFIIRGLARNEDEFFKATGSEVSTLWHAPWYYVNSMIIDASKSINYTYVSRDIDSLDWVGINYEQLYAPASDLIDRIMKMKKPGSIISIDIGVEEIRDDYLYQKIDHIKKELLRQGYEIVDVSTIMENAR